MVRCAQAAPSQNTRTQHMHTPDIVSGYHIGIPHEACGRHVAPVVDHVHARDLQVRLIDKRPAPLAAGLQLCWHLVHGVQGAPSKGSIQHAGPGDCLGSKALEASRVQHLACSIKCEQARGSLAPACTTEELGGQEARKELA